jgi:hypothetical protein
LKGLEILGLTNLIFSIKIWDFFSVRREVKHSQGYMRIIIEKNGK